MKRLKELSKRLEQLLDEERHMMRQLDDLEDAAVAAEKDSIPEAGRILLIHADIIRATLEQSRRRWMRSSAALSVALLICLGLLLYELII